LTKAYAAVVLQRVAALSDANKMEVALLKGLQPLVDLLRKGATKEVKVAAKDTLKTLAKNKYVKTRILQICPFFGSTGIMARVRGLPSFLFAAGDGPL